MASTSYVTLSINFFPSSRNSSFGETCLYNVFLVCVQLSIFIIGWKRSIGVALKNELVFDLINKGTACNAISFFQIIIVYLLIR